MHLFNLFSRIQFLRHLDIISARQLPVESVLHDAWLLGCFGDFWLAFHSLGPLRFFFSLSLFPFPHNPLYQNVSSITFSLPYHSGCSKIINWNKLYFVVSKASGRKEEGRCAIFHVTLSTQLIF